MENKTESEDKVLPQDARTTIDLKQRAVSIKNEHITCCNAGNKQEIPILMSSDDRFPDNREKDESTKPVVLLRQPQNCGPNENGSENVNKRKVKSENLLSTQPASENNDLDADLQINILGSDHLGSQALTSTPFDSLNPPTNEEGTSPNNCCLASSVKPPCNNNRFESHYNGQEFSEENCSEDTSKRMVENNASTLSTEEVANNPKSELVVPIKTQCNNSNEYHASRIVHTFLGDEKTRFIIDAVFLYFILYSFKQNYMQDTIAITLLVLHNVISRTSIVLVYAVPRVEPDYEANLSTGNIDPNGLIEIYEYPQEVRLGHTTLVDVNSNDQLAGPHLAGMDTDAQQQMPMNNTHQATTYNREVTTITTECSSVYALCISSRRSSVHFTSLLRMSARETHQIQTEALNASSQVTASWSIATSSDISMGFPVAEVSDARQDTLRERSSQSMVSAYTQQSMQYTESISHSQAAAMGVSHQESTVVTTLSPTTSAGLPAVEFSSLNVFQYTCTHSAHHDVVTAPGHSLPSLESNAGIRIEPAETENRDEGNLNVQLSMAGVNGNQRGGILPTGFEPAKTLSRNSDLEDINGAKHKKIVKSTEENRKKEKSSVLPPHQSESPQTGSGTRGEDLFRCGGVHTWDPGEHARRFPNSPCLREKKGSEFVENVMRRPSQLEASGGIGDEQDGRRETQQTTYSETEIDSIYKENRLLKEKIICKLCNEREVSVVFLTCGHVVCCKDCGARYRNCPLCNVVIKDVRDIFFD